MIAVGSILIIDDVHNVRLGLLALIRQQFPDTRVEIPAKQSHYSGNLSRSVDWY